MERACLNCEKNPANFPSEDPVFCSWSCAGAFARNAWAWCEKHNCWWNVSFGCEQCNNQRKISDLRQRQKELEKEIRKLEEKPPEKLMKG